MAVIYLVTGNVFTLQGFAAYTRPDNLKIGIASNQLLLADTVAVKPSPIRLDAINYFNMNDEARNTNLVVSVGSFLDLRQGLVPPRVFEIFVSDLLALTHHARPVFHEIVEQTLTFVDHVDTWSGFHNQLSLSQSVSFHITKVEPVTDVLTLTQGVTVYKTNDPYFLAIGIATVYDPAIVEIPPLPNDFQNVTLDDQNGRLLTLTIPLFDNDDKIQHQRINRNSRAGDLIIFRDPVWPKSETLKLKFGNLDQHVGKNLLAFVSDTVGQQIVLTDHEGVKWRGFIMNPDLQLVQAARSTCLGFEAEIDFEGAQTA